jgi:hypothetical protein
MEDESETGCEICVWSGGFKFPFGRSLLVGAHALVLGVRCVNCSWIPQHYPVFTSRCVFILLLCILLPWSLDCFHKVVRIDFRVILCQYTSGLWTTLLLTIWIRPYIAWIFLHFHWLLQCTSVRDLLSRTTWRLYTQRKWKSGPSNYGILRKIYVNYSNY